MIYFLRPVAGGPIEIGRSADVEMRRRRPGAHYGRESAPLRVMEERLLAERARARHLPEPPARGGG